MSGARELASGVSRQLDSLSLAMALLGAVIGVALFISPTGGAVLFGVVAPAAALLLMIRDRWLEIGLMLLVMGAVASVGYAIGGLPPMPAASDAVPPGELFALMIAGVSLVGGVLLTGIGIVLQIRQAQRVSRIRMERIERHRQRDQR